MTNAKVANVLVGGGTRGAPMGLFKRVVLGKKETVNRPEKVKDKKSLREKVKHLRQLAGARENN